MVAPLPELFRLYAGLSTPALITDAEYRIVYLNPRAEAFWNTTLAACVGRPAGAALHIRPPGGQAVRAWGRAVVFPALTTGDPFTAEVVGPDGRLRSTLLCATRFSHRGRWYTAVIVPSETVWRPRSGQSDCPLHDGLTGLPNRHRWQREAAYLDDSPGSLAFFDIHRLRSLNDLGGHRCGDDALLATARALRRYAPAEALSVRWSGDEFLLVLPRGTSGAVAAVAAQVAGAAAATGAGLPLPLRVRFRTAAFAAGGLAAAVDAACRALDGGRSGSGPPGADRCRSARAGRRDRPGRGFRAVGTGPHRRVPDRGVPIPVPADVPGR